MKLLHLDCFAGIAGDMLLGALLDCGIGVDELGDALRGLVPGEWHLQAETVRQQGLHGTQVRVLTEHAHQHNQHGHVHEQDNHHGRTLADVERAILTAALPEPVTEAAIAIFRRLARAEAAVHQAPVETVHFHEVGAVDALVDICGAAWCLHHLEVDSVSSSPLPYSTGFVDCDHGRIPLPAPATLELLKDAPWTPTNLQGEMVTPTGAAIVSELARQFGPPPPMLLNHVGYGAGQRQWPDRPNLLRVLLGYTPVEAGATDALQGLQWQQLSLLEANLDDMNPEWFDAAFAALFEAGALDVWLQPVQMKKQRPAWVLGALHEPQSTAAVAQALFRHTTTLGARLQQVQRISLPRRTGRVQTVYGPVAVKYAEWPQQQLKLCTPEHDDALRIASLHGVTLREVYEAVLREALPD